MTGAPRPESAPPLTPASRPEAGQLKAAYWRQGHAEAKGMVARAMAAEKEGDELLAALLAETERLRAALPHALNAMESALVGHDYSRMGQYERHAVVYCARRDAEAAFAEALRASQEAGR